MYSNKGEQSVGKIRLQVTDGSKFSNFLLAVNLGDTTDEFQQNVADVAYGLIAEASDAIANDSDEQTALETLAYGKGIVAGLEHIGLAKSPVIVKLRNLYEHAQQGDVKEYVQADNIGLLKGPEEQGYGPAKWQRDASTERLVTFWDQVLDVLKATKAKPNAKALFVQLTNSAQASLDYAKADWAKIKAEGYGGGGKAFDWSLIPPSVPVPVVLSGGLNPANVIDGVVRVRPWAVDVSSGVESAKGIKSAALMRRFCKAVREADARIASL